VVEYRFRGVGKLPRVVLEEILLPAEEIGRKVEELAREINQDYAGRRVTVVGVLKGAYVFVADLLRHLDPLLEVRLDFISVSSYGNAQKSSGEVRLLKDLEESVEGKNVLLVEDIVDTGLTLDYLCRLLWARRPADLRVCVLLDKRSRRVVKVPLDYVGFIIPDRFVVGYGLDCAGMYRHLPYVAAVRVEEE
jgi:hypoxanthine phosphoribosyltransferase